MIRIHLVKQLIGCQSDCHTKLKVFCIGSNLHIIGNFQLLRRNRKVILKSGESDTNHGSAAAIVNELPVGDLYICENIIVQQDTRKHCKRHVDFFLLPINLNILVLLIRIVETDRHLTAFPSQFCRRYCFTVQLVCNGQSNRQFLFDIALIVNIIALCVPDTSIIAAKRITFITLDIFYIRQFALITDRVTAKRVFNPVTDNDFLYRAVCSGYDIYCFILRIALFLRSIAS